MKRMFFVAGLALAVAGAAPGQASKSAAAKPPKYKKHLPAALVKEAKLKEPQAADSARKAIPGATIDNMALEKDKDGKLIYAYDLKTKDKKGYDEVRIDAMTGAVVGNVHETKAEEKAEKKAPKKPPTAKKP